MVQGDKGNTFQSQNTSSILEAKVLNKPILITDTAAREAVEGYTKSQIVENTENGIYEGIKNSISVLSKDKKDSIENFGENLNIIKEIEKLVM